MKRIKFSVSDDDYSSLRRVSDACGFGRPGDLMAAIACALIGVRGPVGRQSAPLIDSEGVRLRAILDAVGAAGPVTAATLFRTPNYREPLVSAFSAMFPGSPPVTSPHTLGMRLRSVQGRRDARDWHLESRLNGDRARVWWVEKG